MWWRGFGLTRRDLFERAWGVDKLVADIGQADVDRFADMRRMGQLRTEQSSRKGGVRDGTIEADLRWLSTVFRWPSTLPGIADARRWVCAR